MSNTRKSENRRFYMEFSDRMKERRQILQKQSFSRMNCSNENFRILLILLPAEEIEQYRTMTDKPYYVLTNTDEICKLKHITKGLEHRKRFGAQLYTELLSWRIENEEDLNEKPYIMVIPFVGAYYGFGYLIGDKFAWGKDMLNSQTSNMEQQSIEKMIRLMDDDALLMEETAACRFFVEAKSQEISVVSTILSELKPLTISAIETAAKMANLYYGGNNILITTDNQNQIQITWSNENIRNWVFLNRVKDSQHIDADTINEIINAYLGVSSEDKKKGFEAYCEDQLTLQSSPRM